MGRETMRRKNERNSWIAPHFLHLFIGPHSLFHLSAIFIDIPHKNHGKHWIVKNATQINNVYQIYLLPYLSSLFHATFFSCLLICYTMGSSIHASTNAIVKDWLPYISVGTSIFVLILLDSRNFICFPTK